MNRILGTGRCETVEIAIAAKLIFIRATLVVGEAGGAGTIQVEVTSRLIDGAYPAYRNALPVQPQSEVTFAARELASAVRRTASDDLERCSWYRSELTNDRAC